MDLSLDESQTILVRTFADFFAKECTSELVRKAEDVGISPRLWQLFSKLGAPCMGLPESVGGLDMGLLELCLVAVEAGKKLAPLPFVEVASAGRLLTGFPETEPLLESIGRGATLISLVDPDVAGEDPGKVLVPYGGAVSHVIIREGDSIVLYEDPESRLISQPSNLGCAAHGFWNLSPSKAEGRRVLGQGTDAVARFVTALAERRLLTAAMLVGLAQDALHLGVDYAKTREQFGTAIASFQAIAHPLAECAMYIDGAELLVWQAAWAAEEVPERFNELCSMAMAFAGQTAQQVSSVSLHTHGGYGFCEEYDIQLYYRRACSWAQMAGGLSNELLRVTQLRGESRNKLGGC